MSRSLVAVVLVLGAFGSVPASAQERPQRFTMTPTEGGFVRLDTETGAVSICTRRDGAWACEPMPEERQALSREIERLQTENKRLRMSSAGLGQRPASQRRQPGRRPARTEGAVRAADREGHRPGVRLPRGHHPQVPRPHEAAGRTGEAGHAALRLLRRGRAAHRPASPPPARGRCRAPSWRGQHPARCAAPHAAMPSSGPRRSSAA